MIGLIFATTVISVVLIACIVGLGSAPDYEKSLKEVLYIFIFVMFALLCGLIFDLTKKSTLKDIQQGEYKIERSGYNIVNGDTTILYNIEPIIK